MLLKKAPENIRRKVTLELPSDVWHRLDELERHAGKHGYTIDIEGSLAQHLRQQLWRAEKSLTGARAAADEQQHQATSSHSTIPARDS